MIREEGSAAIYVTHDLAVVAQIADHIVVLYGGEVMEQGPADEIINRAGHAYTRRLMAAVRPSPAAGQGDESTGEHLRADPAIVVKHVTAGYGGIVNGAPAITILRNINIDIERGEVVGVIGESGCGKSTLARVVAGLLPAAQGQVILDGTELKPALKDRSRADLQKVQFVFQMADTALNPKHRLGDILGRPIEFYQGLKGKEKRQKVAELLQMVELPQEFAYRYPQELSGGQKQRVNLARALAADPEVLLCDEVTSALDTIVGANVIELLKGLRKNLGVSFVFISHDLSTVASFADKIVVLYAGRVVEQGPVDKVLSPPYHPYTRLLITSVPEMRIGWLEDTMETREAAAGIARGVEITAVGCPFFNRCPLAIEGTCDKEMPPVREESPGHQISCHLTLDTIEEASVMPQEILHGYDRLTDPDTEAVGRGEGSRTVQWFATPAYCRLVSRTVDWEASWWTLSGFARVSTHSAWPYREQTLVSISQFWPPKPSHTAIALRAASRLVFPQSAP